MQPGDSDGRFRKKPKSIIFGELITFDRRLVEIRECEDIYHIKEQGKGRPVHGEVAVNSKFPAGISGSLNDARHVTKLSDPESLESAINQPEAATSLGNAVKSEIPVDASLQEINATGSVEAKQVQMSSVQPNDLKGIEEINTSDGYVDAVDASVKVSQSLASDTDEKTSNNESYESKPQEAEGKNSEPLSLTSDLLGAAKKVSSPVESELPEADEQVTVSLPVEANLPHKERENPDSADFKLDLSEADVRDLDTVNVDREQEQEQLYTVEQDKQRISTLVQAPNVLLLESEADFSKEKDGGSQREFLTSKTREGREDAYVVSLAKDLRALDNPELLLKDLKDHSKSEPSFQLGLGSSEVICPSKNDDVATAWVNQSFVDTGRPDESISTVALNVSGDQVSEEKVVSAEGKTDSSGLANSNVLKEPEDSSKNSPLSGTPADHSGMDIIISSVQEEAKQTTIVDDPSIERSKASFALAEENKDGHTENEYLAEKETTHVDTSSLSEANQTVVTLGGSYHEEHEKPRTEHPTVAGVETEEKLARVSESDKTTCPIRGHDDRTDVTDKVVYESRNDIFYEVSKDSINSNDAKALESTSATGLDSDVISDGVVKEPTGWLVDTDLNSRVVDNFHVGDGLKSATGIDSSASQNEDYDKLIKQNDIVSPVDISMTSSRAANWGSVSVLSTQSESTAVPDAEAADAGGLEKLERDVQKSTSGAEECRPDKSDVYKLLSFAASEIETQLTTQQPKMRAMKAGFNVTDGWIICIPPELACSNAYNHIWWDQFHPTDAVNTILADNVWSSLHTTICYPKLVGHVS